MSPSQDRTFADVSIEFDLWKAIDQRVDLSSLSPETIKEGKERMSLWLDGFLAGMSLKREDFKA